MAGGRGDRGVWVELGKTGDCMVDAMYKGARMWLEVGEIEDCMMDAMCQEPEYGWR